MQSNGSSIKNWAIDDRPREKLLKSGSFSLSNAELIAILIGSGNKSQSAVDLAKQILRENANNLINLGRLSIADLIKFNGIGEAKAITIIAALELGKRQRKESAATTLIIKKSKTIFEHIRPIFINLNIEEFWVIFLNRSNKIIDQIKISQGGISGTVVDSRIIIKHALEKYASNIILAHNHPSGNIQPSIQDKNITNKIKEAANLFDIKVLDHIIVGTNEYLSFADQGIL